MSKTITEWELIDHGIEGAQYFQGCGIAFTDFEDCFTGIGGNFAEAIDDCLENIASAGEYEVDGFEERLKKEEGFKDWPADPNTDKYHEENEDCEMYYYVSIRLK